MSVYTIKFKFRENTNKNRFREISLSVRKIAKFKKFAKVITYSKSPDYVLQSYIYILCSYFKSSNYLEHPFWSQCEVISRKLLIKSRNRNFLDKIKLNRNLHRIIFKMMYNMSMLCHRFSNERWEAP